jgi:hypothetical protein
MLAVFEPLDRAQSKKNFEPSFVKIGWRVQKLWASEMATINNGFNDCFRVLIFCVNSR